MKMWEIKRRFPTSEVMARMVAAEVRVRVEAAMEQAKATEEALVKRRDHLRDVYRKHIQDNGMVVDFAEVREIIEEVAGVSLSAWMQLSKLDHIALAEAGTRDDFIELEFLVNRGLSELNGIKNIISLARRLV